MSWFQALLDVSSAVAEVGLAAEVADQQYLERFQLRGPGRWPLVAFRIQGSPQRVLL